MVLRQCPVRYERQSGYIPGMVNHPPVVQDGLTEFGTVLGDTDGLGLI